LRPRSSITTAQASASGTTPAHVQATTERVSDRTIVGRSPAWSIMRPGDGCTIRECRSCAFAYSCQWAAVATTAAAAIGS